MLAMLVCSNGNGESLSITRHCKPLSVQECTCVFSLAFEDEHFVYSSTSLRAETNEINKVNIAENSFIDLHRKARVDSHVRSLFAQTKSVAVFPALLIFYANLLGKNFL